MKKTVRDFSLDFKTVILRCDLNVTIKDNIIVDDTRIKESLETIKYILEHNAKVVILSHLGKIKTEEDKEKNNLKIVCDRLNYYLDNKITFVEYDEDVKKVIETTPYKKGILLQNTRYFDLDNKKESNCDEELSKYFASLGDIFINDAFGLIHRCHASNVGISKLLPSGIGFLMEKELSHLDMLDNPTRPFCVIMGGAKVSDKIEVINSLIDKVDKLFIGGAMCFTFLKSKNIDVGNSLVENHLLEYCSNLLDKYKDKIILPIDVDGAFSFNNEEKLENYSIMNIPSSFIGMDIGKKSVELFKDELSSCKTLFWNGPLGVYEFSKYQEGTKDILEFVCDNIETVILGGGDIVSCCNILGYNKRVSFISTGGGASLSYLANKNQPGLEYISEK